MTRRAVPSEVLSRAMVRHGVVLCLCLAFFVSPAAAALSQLEFQRVLAKYRETATRASENDMLRAIDALDSIISWSSPDSDAKINDMANKYYDVVLYHIPPFVMIQNRAAKGDGDTYLDPGNALQTRTPQNGLLSGITIDVLSQIQKETNVKFRFFYPCRKAKFDADKECPDDEARSSTVALEMLDSVTSASKMAEFCGGGTAFCGTGQGKAPLCHNDDPNVADSANTGRCLVAGALKTTHTLHESHFVTSPYMQKGFILATKESPGEPGLLAAFDPLHWKVWAVLMALLVFAGICLGFAEGYGDNEGLPFNPLGLLMDCMYWSITLMIGVPDKQPVTDGGRTIVLGMLFLTLMMQTCYTGSLNSMLMFTPFFTKISGKSDIVASGKWSLCLAGAESGSSWAYYNNSMVPIATSNDVTTTIIKGKDPKDCLWKVYTDEASATFFDEPIIKYRIANDFHGKGRCGTEGGYCWDNENKTILEAVSMSKCNEKDQRVKAPSVPGSLTTVGSVFDVFGYGFAFPRKIGKEQTGAGDLAGKSDYMAFNQVIAYLKEKGEFDKSEATFIAGDPECAAAPASSVLSVKNMLGLFIFTGVITFVGLVISVVERFILIFAKICPCACCKELLETDGNEGGAAGDGEKDGEDGVGKSTEAAEGEGDPPPPGDAVEGEEVVEAEASKEVKDANGGAEQDGEAVLKTITLDNVHLPGDLRGAKTSECLIELEVRLERIEEQLENLVYVFESSGNGEPQPVDNQAEAEGGDTPALPPLVETPTNPPQESES